MRAHYERASRAGNRAGHTARPRVATSARRAERDDAIERARACGPGAIARAGRAHDHADGEVISDTVPRVVLEGSPMDLIVQTNHARGLSIDDCTGVCQWNGVPMDASMAVEGVLQARGECEF